MDWYLSFRPNCTWPRSINCRTGGLSNTQLAATSERKIRWFLLSVSNMCWGQFVKTKRQVQLCAWVLKPELFSCLACCRGSQATWLLFQNSSIACFVWTRSFQSAGEHRTDVAIHNASVVTITERPCQSWCSQSPAAYLRGPGLLPGHSVWCL